MNTIEIAHLHKNYHTRVKDAGLKASFRALVKPQYKDIAAVEDVSFTIEAGEIIAFIGPNGAGKSTTIKMMTGILHPSSGHVRVLGLDPARDRQKLSRRIGTVFGQKSQLWFHLPPSDSFDLLGSIYDVPKNALKVRIKELVDVFEIGDLMTQPVRKMSLGQRIRCEIAASLLHEPEILFLDEPTIGLDVVVKQAIRTLILRLNREKGTTIFLTSHDAGDVEQVCRRAMVIDDGHLVLDQSVEDMQRKFLQKKVVRVVYERTIDDLHIDGVEMEKENPYTYLVTVDTQKTPIGGVLSCVTAAGGVSDITINDPPMEEIIAAIFAHKEG